MFPDGIAHGYHLFLLPDEPTRSSLGRHIDMLAALRGGPRFAPHVTLLAGIPAALGREEIMRRTTEIAHGEQALSLSLEECAGEEYFFRTLYARITPAPPLMALHEKSARTFGLPAKPYLPHASLFYGTLTDQERTALMQEIPVLAGTPFLVRTISVFETEGPADAWKEVGTIPLAA